jgi:tetratricopeptide (TPR) repeat protein
MVITMMGINDQFYFSESEMGLPIEIQLVLLKSKVYKFARLAWVDLKHRFDTGASAQTSGPSDAQHWRAYSKKFKVAHAAWRRGEAESVERNLRDVIRMARETARSVRPRGQAMLDLEPVYLRFYTLSYLDLGEFYLSRGREAEAVALYEEAIASHPDAELFYRALAGIHEKLGNGDRADVYRRSSRELASRRILDVTRSGYEAVRRILRAEETLFVAMQYPLRSVETLKVLLDDAEDVIYVDNEAIFREGVASLGYDELFIDRAVGDFGHCTERGNRLIAENLVTTVFEPVFADGSASKVDPDLR